jgi:signal transduction histidine kinase
MGLVGALAFGGTGVWLTWTQPRQPIGWVSLGVGSAAALSLGASEWGLWALDRGVSATSAGLVIWFGNWVWVASIVPVASVVPLLVPDGHLPSPRWRPVLAAGVVAVLAAAASFAFVPYDATTPELAEAGLSNPAYVAALSTPAVRALLTLLTVLGSVLAVAGLVTRWRRSTGVVRQQLKWVLLGVATAVVLFAAGFALGPTVTALAMLPVPLGILVAVLRYGLWDVDVVISRSLVYAALMACVVGVYVAVVALLGGLLGRTTGAPIVATALVAVAVEPLHRRLRALVNRLVHGTAEDPLTALAGLGGRLAAAQDPTTVGEQLLPQLAAATARSLHLPHVGVLLADGTVVEHGDRGPLLEELPLRYAGTHVGSLAVTPRGAEVDRRTRERLTRLADQVAVAAHSVLLANALRSSREETVSAREEERRRLYRDLHDGLGPALAALALNVEVARDSLEAEPERTAVLLDRALPRLKATVDEVRAVVHGLRPPAVDELGLAGAVRELAAGFVRPDLSVRVEADSDMSGLPAATEVATYRIVAEALNNVSRHSGANQVVVSMVRYGDEVHVSVEDDGRGLLPGAVPGLGLASMTGRAEEAGGRLGVGPGAEGRGTSVRAVLPAVAL